MTFDFICLDKTFRVDFEYQVQRFPELDEVGSLPYIETHFQTNEVHCIKVNDIEVPATPVRSHWLETLLQDYYVFSDEINKLVRKAEKLDYSVTEEAKC